MSMIGMFSELRNVTNELARQAREIRNKNMELKDLDKPIAKELGKKQDVTDDAAGKKDGATGDKDDVTKNVNDANENNSDATGNTTGDVNDSSGEANAEDKEGINAGENADEGTEKKELTYEEINELQRNAIKDAFRRIMRGEKLSDAEKGNLGEMLMDQYYISKGYRPIHQDRVTDLSHKSGQGIDGVYEKINSDGSKSYIIADAKVNYSRLNKDLKDGTTQMSDMWISKRLEGAVGKEKADEISDAFDDNPESVSHEVYHFSYGDAADGSATADVYTVDENGNKNSKGEVVQKFDTDGNPIVVDTSALSENINDVNPEYANTGDFDDINSNNAYNYYSNNLTGRL